MMEQELFTNLYSVRHGETEWNRAGIQQGHLNSPLTANGIKQARSLAKGLSGRGIEVIISSDLGRASQTADIIAKDLNLPLNTDNRLRERNLGILQGMTIEEFK
ncbi:MAG: histidine phosphatase family protein [Fibrobacter sp.]|nr:histidine phosphatase family protein [Fibrobacter sp.]